LGPFRRLSSAPDGGHCGDEEGNPKKCRGRDEGERIEQQDAQGGDKKEVAEDGRAERCKQARSHPTEPGARYHGGEKEGPRRWLEGGPGRVCRRERAGRGDDRDAVVLDRKRFAIRVPHQAIRLSSTEAEVTAWRKVTLYYGQRMRALEMSPVCPLFADFI